MLCHICKSITNLFGDLVVLSKYKIQYFQCTSCGFMQTEAPYWLDEAYSDAIARQDVGIMVRNQLNVSLTSSLLCLLFPETAQALDFGGGHGVFVRMMRDQGFNFFWRDLFAANHFARGFEYDPAGRYSFLTAFEVLEHFVDPLTELDALMTGSDNVFVSTLTLPDPAPKLSDWWYYVPSSGQHVSFYTREALQKIATRFDRHLQTNGTHHLFTKTPVSTLRFRLAMNPRTAKGIRYVISRPSLTSSDFERLTKHPVGPAT